MFLLRLAFLFFVAEATALARARAPLGDWLPDGCIALAAAFALEAKPNKILPLAILLACLRAPTSLAEPLSGSAAFIGFVLLAAEARRFVTRERPAVGFFFGFAASLAVASVGMLASAWRGEGSPTWISALPSAAATGALTIIWIPVLRKLPFTRRLLERRFGE